MVASLHFLQSCTTFPAFDLIFNVEWCGGLYFFDLFGMIDSGPVIDDADLGLGVEPTFGESLFLQ